MIIVSACLLGENCKYNGGNNVDNVLRRGVEKAMDLVRREDVQCAILQSRSPTCGVKQIYDGTFSGKLVDGAGIFARALMDAGYLVLDAEEISSKRPIGR